MQSFLKAGFVQSSDTARIAHNIFAFLFSAFICSAAVEMMGSAPADAAPTVGDIRNIVLGTLLLAGGLYLMVDSIARTMKLVFKK